MAASLPSDRLQVLSRHLAVNMSRAPITTHVLDTALGKPAAGVPITLSYLPSALMQPNAVWTDIGSGTTDEDGRCSNLLTLGQLNAGTYRVHFDTTSYFARIGNHEPFYPYVEVVFSLKDITQHYHIPLLLSPFSYSTYRGS